MDQELIRSVGLDVSDLPKHKHFDAWADLESRFAEHRSIGDGTCAVSWFRSAWAVGDIVFTENVLGGFTANRTPTLIRRANFESVVVRFVLDGSQNAVFDDQLAPMRPGEIHIFDLDTQYHAVTPVGLHSLAVKVPHTLIGYDRSRHPRHMAFYPPMPIYTLLRCALVSIREQLPMLRRSDAPQFAAAFCGLLRGVLLADGADEEARTRLRAAQRSAIELYLQERIDDPSVDTREICHKFGLSRATLYRMFNSDGGLEAFRVRLRLTHAFRLLWAAEPERGSIKTISDGLGFKDQAYFTRLFKKRYGITPSDALDR